jgi:hypothetical protein
MDGSQYVRGADIVVRVLPIGWVADDDHGFGFRPNAVQGE